MECHKVKNQLVNFFYKELEKDSLVEVQNHVSTCAECSIIYGNISKVLGAADDVKDAQTNAFYSTRLFAKIEGTTNATPYWMFQKKLLRPVLLVSMAALGIFVGVTIGNKLPEKTTTTENGNVIISTLASEYYVGTSNEDNLENYYLTDKK